MRKLKLVLAAIPLVAGGSLILFILGTYAYSFLASLDGKAVFEYIGLWSLIMWVVWGVRYISNYRELSEIDKMDKGL